MNKLKKTFELQASKTVYDEFGQLKKSYEKLKEIDVIVVMKSKKVIDNGAEYTLVENSGLTTFKDITEGMKLVSIDNGTEYEVSFVNHIPRWVQLDLKEIR